MTTWGREGEGEAVRGIMQRIPKGGLAMVVDSYDIWRMLETTIGEELREIVEGRQKEGGGFLVVRPDSGDPKEVLTRVFSILGDKFGYTTNTKGYKVLPECIRVIQGDGINYESIGDIPDNLTG